MVSLNFEGMSRLRLSTSKTVDGTVTFLIHHEVLESHKARTHQTVESSDGSIEYLSVTLAL